MTQSLTKFDVFAIRTPTNHTQNRNPGRKDMIPRRPTITTSPKKETKPEKTARALTKRRTPVRTE